MSDIGNKCDDGKVRVGLMMKDFARALWEVARVSTHGAITYSPSGWVLVHNREERYEDALGRHYLKGLAGRVYDDDSGLLEAAHTAWNALATLELMLRNGTRPDPMVNNKYKVGPKPEQEEE